MSFTLNLTDKAEDNFKYWSKHDSKILKKIFTLIDNINETPYSGIGKPEPLKQNLSGLWSRRITQKHRLIYSIEGNNLIIYQCRYHY